MFLCFVIFDCFHFFNDKNTKSVKFARIGLISVARESPHRVLDSSVFFAILSKKKNGGKHNLNFPEKTVFVFSPFFFKQFAKQNPRSLKHDAGIRSESII